MASAFAGRGLQQRGCGGSSTSSSSKRLRLLPSAWRPAVAAHVASRDHEGPARDHLPLNEGLPLSLFHPYRNLPPEGSTLHKEEATCDPEERVCKTPAHTYEAACAVCSGTGWARNASGGRRRTLGTCIACHGLGYVRRTTSRFWPDSPHHLTLARDAPTGPPPRRSPFDARRKQRPPTPPPAPPAQQQREQQQQRLPQQQAPPPQGQRGGAAKPAQRPHFAAEGMAPEAAPAPVAPPAKQQPAQPSRPQPGGQVPPPRPASPRLQPQAS